VVIVGLMVAMALRRRDVAVSELPVLLAITRLYFILRLPLTWRLRPVAIPLIRLIAARRRPRILLVGFMAAKPTHSITVTDSRVTGTGCDAPLWLVLLTIALPRSIAMRFGHLAVVVLQALAARLVHGIFAPRSRRLRRAARFAIAKFVSGASRRSIGRPIFRVRPPTFLAVCFSRLNDGVEPLAHGHAGAPRRVSRGGARFRTETSQIPRTT
jgi:hypothetical protein